MPSTLERDAMIEDQTSPVEEDLDELADEEFDEDEDDGRTYTFDELSEEAKQRAIDWYVSHCANDDCEDVAEHMYEEAEFYAIDVATTQRGKYREKCMYWDTNRGSWVGVDGSLDLDRFFALMEEGSDLPELREDSAWKAAFECFSILKHYNLDVRLKRRHHGGSCESTYVEISHDLDRFELKDLTAEDFEDMGYEQPSAREMLALRSLGDIEEIAQNLVDDIVDRLLKFGRDEYDYRYSDEHAKEMLSGNDAYEFTRDGEEA